MIVDSHVHLNSDCFNDIEQYIRDAKKENVNLFLCVGWDLKSSIKAIEISNKFDEVYACVGVHPEEIKNMQKTDFLQIEKLLKNKKIVAIGEVGLDFHTDNDEDNQEKQKQYFIKFIQLANEYNLPVVIHSRNADKETLEILKKYKIKKNAVLHCCSLGENFINEYLKLEIFFGIGGIITFKNAVKLRNSLLKIPLNKILLETDAPFLAPHPFRGKINHSKYLKYVIQTISEQKNINNNEIIYQTTKNFMNLFIIS